MRIGLYLHLPFCKKKCPYCDFFSVEELPQEDLYLKALLKELELLSKFLKKYFQEERITIETFYAGGGTPSLFSPFFYERLFESLSQTFEFSPIELTLEANPESLTFEKAKDYRSLGFNRISLGIQTFQKRGLRFLQRIHSLKESIRAIEGALKAGFENISLDFIYGWIGQGVKSLEKDLKLALTFKIKHLSFYELTLYPGTPFYKKFGKNPSFLREKRLLNLYSFLRNYLYNQGFFQYEISNYARPGFEAKHNLKYWKIEPYLGIGAGAVSRIGNLRFENTKKLKEYFEKLLEKKVLPHRLIEKLDNFEFAKEYLFMGLRLVEGINLSKLNTLGYTIEKGALFLLEKRGYLKISKDSLSLSEKGMSLHNQVVKFLWDHLVKVK
ncbi:MAG: radical SAM family heme chaperone HemW [Caldimicrobium sp.]